MSRPALPLLPVLYVSHGAPLFAIEAGTTGPALTRWGRQLAASATLRGIVIMSPHWMARAPAVMSNPAPATWHDFGGFPPALYELQYPAAGHPALASEVLGLLKAAGLPADSDAERPLDHGAWVPLMHLFPEAQVPVVQVALPVGAGPAQVLAMGRALSGLREQGVLLIGSGSMTHNLREFFGGAREPAPYVIEFSRWVESAIERGDQATLLDYRRQAPHAQRAHPSEDHFLPLFFALGAAGWGEDESVKADYLSREVMYGILAMDSFALATAQPA
ncbi:DODA-type extradiol aromatic ring-opening family dioxygenase [Polaromonas jejuensis]|uniref:DODA-type extradiol aromatic ring-opening family dioxygenase n=1 Tax=Polaromonas jejuensis TaxID=457502 RepID=A0ABW0QID4_9BURK|nr:class III extradiol ring-cleavage dioxygenase [Polaromonas jejuensis]